MTTTTIGLFLRHLALSEEVSRLGTVSDQDLLTAYESEHGQAAFAELMRRHGPMVLRTCRRVLGRGPDAEDAFQAAFVLLARKATSLRREIAARQSLGGWLHRVAYQTALNVLAGVARRRAYERQASVMIPSDPDPSVEATWNEVRPILDAELDALPEQARQLLIACYLEGKTHAEAAAELGLPLGSLARRLERARALLATRLLRRGISVPMVLLGVLLEDLANGAGVPAVLLVYTLEAARTFNERVSGVVSAHVASLVKGALGGMAKSSTKFNIMLACCLGLVGAGLVACRTLSAWPDEPAAAGPTATQVAERPEQGGERRARTDRDGNPLPQGALARLGTLRLRHAGSYGMGGAESVLFSLDGKVLVTAGCGNPIQLWDTTSGKLLRSFGGRRENATLAIVLSPNGKTLAARTDENGSVSLWEVTTGKLLRQLPKAGIRALAFSRDSRTLLSADQDNHIRVWEVATGKEGRDQLLLNAETEASIYIFSPDGKTLVSISEDDDKTNIVHLWESATGKELRHLTLGKKREVPRGDVTFSPDSRFLAVSSIARNDGNLGDMAVHLWEVATGKEVRKWMPDKTGTYSMAFSPDSKLLATGSGFGPIRLWEVTTGKELRQCQDYRGHIVALAFSPDGSMLASLTGKHDHTARLWEVASGKERVRSSGGHVGPVVSVSFSPNGKCLLSGGRDGLVGIWDPETGQEQRPLFRVGDFQALIVPSPDGKTFLTVGNSFSPNSLSLEEVIQTPTLICVWDRATGQKLRQFQGPVGIPQSLALSPDGKILVLTSWNSVQLTDVATGKEIRRFAIALPRPKCAALSPDGKTLAVYLWDAMCADTIHFYATATGKELGSIKPQDGGVGCLAFSPDGQTLAVGGKEASPKDGNSHTIRLWHIRADKKDWKEAGRFVGHQDIIWALTFSPDSQTLASASQDSTARLWEVATGKERRRLAGQGCEAWCLAFAPDGRRLAVGGNDTTILVWDMTDRLQSGQLRPTKLSIQEMKGLWADLAGADAVRAGQAVWKLAAAPAQTLPFLREHLRPVAPAGSDIARLIADLDSETFAARQKAMDELAKLGEVAEPALRQALAKPASLEKHRRLEQLLEPLEEKFPLSGEKLRSCRALEVLGQIGTPEARTLLEALAHGEPEARRTLEAQAVLKCLHTRVNTAKP